MNDVDKLWINAAYQEAKRSHDPSTQVGAIIVKNSHVIGLGHNKLPQGMYIDAENYLDKDWKYARVVHAETAAIISAARSAFNNGCRDAVLYGTWACCEQCANDIAEAGIIDVVSHYIPEQGKHPAWANSVVKGIQRLADCGVGYRTVVGEIGTSIRFNGERINV